MLSRDPVSTCAVAVACLLLSLACAPSTYWDLHAVQARNSSLARIEGQRLGDITPYFFPHRQRLYTFTCRWPDEARVRVWLDPSADPEEGELLDLVLKQISRDVRQVTVIKTLIRSDADITVEYATESQSTELGLGTGSAVVDCALSVASLGRDQGRDPSQNQGRSQRKVEASLVRAELLMARRTPPDVRGRTRSLTREEKLGALYHELGHAMGFQGHVQVGETVLTGNRFEVVRRGQAILRGDAAADPNLRALYAIPSGSVLKVKPLAPEQTALIDGFVALAQDKGYVGPLLRVGDQSARLVWTGAQGGQAGFILLNPQTSLLYPEKFVLFEDF